MAEKIREVNIVISHLIFVFFSENVFEETPGTGSVNNLYS